MRVVTTQLQETQIEIKAMMTITEAIETAEESRAEKRGLTSETTAGIAGIIEERIKTTGGRTVGTRDLEMTLQIDLEKTREIEREIIIIIPMRISLIESLLLREMMKERNLLRGKRKI